MHPWIVNRSASVGSVCHRSPAVGASASPFRWGVRVASAEAPVAGRPGRDKAKVGADRGGDAGMEPVEEGGQVARAALAPNRAAASEARRHDSATAYRRP